MARYSAPRYSAPVPSRRGQNASSAAILVALIAGVMIVFILFMSPADRERLLFGDGGSSGGGYGGSGGSGTSGAGGGGGTITQYGPILVFRDTPGTLRLQKASVAEHNIPSATIFTAINTVELKHIDSATVKNGVFSQRSLDIDFDLSKDAGRNFLLSFNIDQPGEGPLRVFVNNKLIYERPVRERSPTPIPLPLDLLHEGTNRVTIAVGDNGLAFWQSNAYLLHNIIITGDVIDVSGSVATQTFSIPDDEYAMFESGELQFVPECDPAKAGRLVVNMNLRTVMLENNVTQQVPNTIYNGFPDCGILFKTDLSKDQLRAGTNNILFAAQGGQYVIDRVKVVVHEREQDYPTYYFNLPRNLYDALATGHNQLRLTLTFSDYRDVKSGEVVVNGFVQSFTSKDYAWQAVIDPGVLTPGPNTIKIAPHADRLDVAELKIEMV